MASNGRHKHTAEPENSTTRGVVGSTITKCISAANKSKSCFLQCSNVVDNGWSRDHNVGHDDKNSLNLTTMSVILIPDNDGVDQHDDDADYQEDDW